MEAQVELARRAFVFGYATVDLYRILHEFALDPASPEYKGPLNTWAHSRQLADPSDTAIVAMNVDTPYSYAWLDLRAEPVVLRLPPFDPGRYMSAMLVDLYTYILGYVSPRTNGTGGGEFLVAGPAWDGAVPRGMRGVFRSPTELALVLLRTQLFEDADITEVARLQDACAVTPLSDYLGTEAPPPPPTLLPVPPVDVRAAPSPAFFDVLAWALALMPPLDGDEAVRADLAALGVVPGRRFVPADAAHATAVTTGMAAGLAEMGAFARTLRSSGEIFGSRSFFAGNHVPRAVGAMLGILGNAAEEYLGIGWQGDADGQPFSGAHRYVVRFGPPEGFPPVDAFWSITLYDAEQHLYANALDRFVINTRAVDSLLRDEDGGVTLHVQHESPGRDREANWLPCPAGPFSLTFRTYLPRAEIRDGTWTAPPVRKAGPDKEIDA